MATPRELVYVPQSFLEARSGVVVSPFQFGLDGNDNLRLVVSNSATGAGIVIQGRRLDATGEIEAFSFRHTPTADRMTSTQVFTLGKGALLNLATFVENATPLIGQTFVILQLVRGFSGPLIVLGTLLQGYITSSQGLGFPGSPIQSSIDAGGYVRSIVGTVPAAGADCVETVPTGARWELLDLFSQITASAAGGTRVPYFFTISNSQYVAFGVQASGAAPSETHAFSWGPNYPYGDDAAHHHHQAPFASPRVLLAGDTFGTLTQAIAAADQWEAPRYRVREWLEVP